MAHRTSAEIGFVKLSDSDFEFENLEQDIRGKDVYDVDGEPRQEVVANVGPAETRERADSKARVKGLLCGVKGCGEAATVEPEVRGFVPTYTLKLPGGRKREYPYLMCPAHAEDYRRAKLYPTVPLFMVGPNRLPW